MNAKHHIQEIVVLKGNIKYQHYTTSYNINININNKELTNNKEINVESPATVNAPKIYETLELDKAAKLRF